MLGNSTRIPCFDAPCVVTVLITVFKFFLQLFASTRRQLSHPLHGCDFLAVVYLKILFWGSQTRCSSHVEVL
jgi:hypothetical protein